MTTFALDADWVEISADDYDEEQDQYGTPLVGRVKYEHGLPNDGSWIVQYFGLFDSEDYIDEYGDDESDEVLETDE